MMTSTSVQDATFVSALQVWLGLSNPSSAQTRAFRAAANLWLNQRISTPPPPAPVPHLITASFTLAAGYGLDALVGALATDIPATGYTVISGAPAGSFVAYSSGNLRTSASAPVLPGTYNLMVSASNANGSGPAAAVNVVLQASAAVPPLSPPLPLTGFPDAANTGVPAGTMLTPSGSLHITTSGQIVGGLLVTGSVQISANNVIFQNSKVVATDFWGVSIDGGCSGVTIQNVEVDGQSGAVDGASMIYVGNTGTQGPTPGLQILGCHLHGGCNGVSIGYGPVLLKDVFIHDMQTSGAGHMNGIQYNGGAVFSGSIDIEHCTVINQQGQTDAIMLDNYYGAVANVTVNNSHFAGGDFSIYCDGRFNSSPFTNVAITNNHVGKGQYDYNFFGGTGVNVIWTGNVDDVTGAPI